MSAADHADASRRLSVAMIVRDTAESLPATLESVAALADEVVVLDTGSIDATADVARRHGAVVHRAAWQDSFAAARNECLQHVTGDWVLWLDAGETIDATAVRQLRNFLAQTADRDKAYLLFIERPALQAAGCCERIGEVRLHARRPEWKFTGQLREHLVTAATAGGLQIDALDCAIHRTAADRDPRRIAARASATCDWSNWPWPTTANSRCGWLRRPKRSPNWAVMTRPKPCIVACWKSPIAARRRCSKGTTAC